MGGPLAGRHLLTTPGLWVGSWLTAGDADWGLYVPVHRDPATGVVLAEARVIIDPHDDVVHTRAALASHAPHHGRLTVHPTPGVDAGLALSYDVLAALGKPVPLTGYRPIDPAPAWSIAAAWILATPITHLTLLRAHLLTLRRRTGIRLILVCHRRALRAFLERELRQVEQSVAEASALLPGTEPATPQPLPAARPLANRWISLPALTPSKPSTRPPARAGATHRWQQSVTSLRRSYRRSPKRRSPGGSTAPQHTPTWRPSSPRRRSPRLPPPSLIACVRDLGPDGATITLHDHGLARAA